MQTGPQTDDAINLALLQNLARGRGIGRSTPVASLTPTPSVGRGSAGNTDSYNGSDRSPSPGSEGSGVGSYGRGVERAWRRSPEAETPVVGRMSNGLRDHSPESTLTSGGDNFTMPSGGRGITRVSGNRGSGPSRQPAGRGWSMPNGAAAPTFTMPGQAQAAPAFIVPNVSQQTYSNAGMFTLHYDIYDQG